MTLETDQPAKRFTRRGTSSSPACQAQTYQPEQWRREDTASDELSASRHGDRMVHRKPDAREQSRLLDLLGRINHRILTGNRVYVEVEGVVYRTLYGGYWCSVFTGIQHYLLRCEQIQTSMWTEETDEAVVIDLPIAYADGGWTTEGCSLSFLLTRDQLAGEII